MHSYLLCATLFLKVSISFLLFQFVGIILLLSRFKKKCICANSCLDLVISFPFEFCPSMYIQVCKCVLLCSRHVLGRPLLMIEVELLKKRNGIDPTYYKVQGIENGIGLWTLFWATND